MSRLMWVQEIPSWVGNSINLVKINLVFCGLKEVDALAQLPNLVRLRLWLNAYVANKLAFHGHSFPKLRILVISSLEELREVTFEQNTLPQIETTLERDRLSLTGLKRHL
uniref:Uncharacterized protein n=1 Tax=Oryza punctata TaxID=4537 RepID=A0A0E0LAK0_ORYPU